VSSSRGSSGRPSGNPGRAAQARQAPKGSALASKLDLCEEADKLPIRRRGIGRRDTLPGAMSRGAD